MRWIKDVLRRQPALTVDVALEPTGRGASFHLYKTPKGFVWDWSALELAAPTPAAAARIQAECRYAIAAMEARLGLPLTYPDFAEIPEGMRGLPGWPWDPESEDPHLAPN